MKRDAVCVDMPDLTDPNRPSNLPLAPVTPAPRKRGLGLIAIAALMAAVGAGAWYLRDRTPTSGSGAPGVFQRR